MPKKKTAPAPKPLKGWTEIAKFMGTTPASAQTWAKQGMPVKREGRFTIADPAEVQAWLPVIIEKDDYDLWLDPGMNDPAKVTDLLKPFDARQMRVYPVSSTVGNVKNDGPECAEEEKIAAGR